MFCEPNGICDAIYTFNIIQNNNKIPSKDTIRRYLQLTRDYKCESCGLTVWNNIKILMESHHIDGNHKNNNDDNLQLLCPNCHAITDNYKGKNRNKGRKEYKHARS